MKITRLLKNNFLIFITIGIMVYFPSLFNGFVWDDVDQIVKNPNMHKFDFLYQLGPTSFNNALFYRPIQGVYISFIYSIFGEQAFVFHVIQVLLHIITSYLLFIFFRIFFNKITSVIIALIFLVHPINAESVLWIVTTTNQIYMIFGISSLILVSKKHLSRSRVVIIITLLLLSVLSREQGILFVILLILYRYIFIKNNLKIFSISGVTIGIVYLLMRYLVGGVVYEPNRYIPLGSQMLLERISSTPAVIMFYVEKFLYPKDLFILQHWIIESITFQSFYLPLMIIILLFLLLISLYYFIRKYEKKQAAIHNKNNSLLEKIKSNQLLFFSVWFALAMAPLMQVIPLDMTVAERFFYLPIVGLLGIVGVLIQFVVTSYSKYNKYIYIAIVVILCLYSTRTFIRTFDWKDNLTLYSHDLRYQKENYILANAYIEELMDRGRSSEALFVAESLVAHTPNIHAYIKIGLIYQHEKQYEKAYEAYMRAIEFSELSSFNDPQNLKYERLAYKNLAILLLSTNKTSEAVQFIRERALKKYPKDKVFYYSLAIAEHELHNNQAALEAAYSARRLGDDGLSDKIIYSIKNNLPINLRLNFSD